MPAQLTVTGQTGLGVSVRGTVVHLQSTRVVFEVYDPQAFLRTSEVLNDFRLVLPERELRPGRAVLTKVVPTGSAVLCEVTLDEAWLESGLPPGPAGTPDADFNAFLRDWQKLYTVRPEFKIVVADLQSFLSDLRLWLEQVELRLHAAHNGDRRQQEVEFMQQLETPVVRAINRLHERFEEIADGLAPEARPAHQSLCRRQLHPLFLCSPFGHRSYTKPLGYAGDYEMVNMIMRSPYEGPSLFAQAVNVWLLRQYPSEAHRNRIRYLTAKLVDETLRASLAGRPARILNLGCGPAHEIQAFLRDSVLSSQADFTLLDFNEETIHHARQMLEQARAAHARQTRFQFQKKSVLGLLRDAPRRGHSSLMPRYDLVYCAGLFDYLPDRTCQQLMQLFYQWLAPGGLVVATNVYACKPFRHMLEFLLDWHLIYRDTRQMLALAPPEAPPGSAVSRSDLTGTNLLLEVRKPG